MGLELGETGSGCGGGFAVEVACCCIGHGSYMRVLCVVHFTKWIFGGWTCGRVCVKPGEMKMPRQSVTSSSNLKDATVIFLFAEIKTTSITNFLYDPSDIFT